MSENAILISVRFPHQKQKDFILGLEELKELALTAGANISGEIHQTLYKPNPRTFIGPGKLEKVLLIYDRSERDLIIFNHELTPTQVRNIEKRLDGRVITRSQLIMDIFALHARTKTARLQVELVQLQYHYSRLKSKWTHLSRIEGGIGMRGPGETQLESDRREIAKRIHLLKQKLKTAEKQKKTQRKKRESVFKAAIVGYTNAGKSTLLNSLVHSEVRSEDRLFVTLDTTTRRIWLGENARLLLTDTVGFIKNLPAALVESFRSTLEDTSRADLLIHVVDISAIDFKKKIEVVNNTLRDIGAGDIPYILCFNKCDLISERERLSVRLLFPEALYISAKEKENISLLKEKLRESVLATVNEQ